MRIGNTEVSQTERNSKKVFASAGQEIRLPHSEGPRLIWIGGLFCWEGKGGVPEGVGLPLYVKGKKSRRRQMGVSVRFKKGKPVRQFQKRKKPWGSVPCEEDGRESAQKIAHTSPG